MYLFNSSSELIELLCERLWSRSRQRGKSHPLIGWDTNAQASVLYFIYLFSFKRWLLLFFFFCPFVGLCFFYSMAIERSVPPFEKIIF